MRNKHYNSLGIPSHENNKSASLGAGEIVQLVNCSQYKDKDLHAVIRTNVEKLGMVRSTCNLNTGDTER